MRRELIAVCKPRANMGKAGRQRSEAGEVRGVSHLAVENHGGSEHEKGLGRQWPGAWAGSTAYSLWSPAIPLLPSTYTQQPSPLLVLVGLPWPTAWVSEPGHIFCAEGRTAVLGGEAKGTFSGSWSVGLGPAAVSWPSPRSRIPGD